MPLSEERFRSLNEMLDRIEPDIKHLSQWQQGFIRDQIARLAQYGQDTFMSDKQVVQIKKAYKEVTGSEYGGEEPPPNDGPSPASKRGRGSYDLDDEIPF